MGVKVTSGMGLPMLHEMSIQRHTQKKIRFWKLADRYKYAQPIGEIFPTPPLSLCSGGGYLTTELTSK
jgi:hypothetical protein